MKFCVIMACHNRRNLTVRSVERARTAARNASIDITFTVFDDGSSDGTAEALAAMSDGAVEVVHGDGTAYWARGMAIAESRVLSGRPDEAGTFIVWLNDDVLLDEGAFSILRSTVAQNDGAVVVGATRDPSSIELTYSGLKRAGIHPLRYTMVAPTSEPQPVGAFNGNLVVVPISIARSLGGIDGHFSHAMADIDYGLRCGRAGVPVLLAPGTYGACPRNAAAPRGSIREDWRTFIGAKGGGNFRSMRQILRKSNRNSWGAVVAITYLTWWTRRVRIALGRGIGR